MRRGNDLEYAPWEEVKAYQDQALAKQVAYAYERSPFYRDLMRTKGLRPEDIQRVEDLQRLPLTGKPDLQQRNWDFCCVPPEGIAEIVGTSGTTGEPLYFALTPRDLDRLARNEELSFLCADTVPGDRFQLMVTLDHLFMAGLAYFLGITRIKAHAHIIPEVEILPPEEGEALVHPPGERKPRRFIDRRRESI